MITLPVNPETAIHVRSGFVSRDHSRTEEDDFRSNVQPKLDRMPYLKAAPQYTPVKNEDEQAQLMGWKLYDPTLTT
jgi:hypothetical protein